MGGVRLIDGPKPERLVQSVSGRVLGPESDFLETLGSMLLAFPNERFGHPLSTERRMGVHVPQSSHRAGVDVWVDIEAAHADDESVIGCREKCQVKGLARLVEAIDALQPFPPGSTNEGMAFAIGQNLELTDVGAGRPPVLDDLELPIRHVTSRLAMASASASTMRWVLARGTSGMTDASITRSPS